MGLSHFPTELHTLLCDAETKGFGHVISWCPDGRSFKIHDKELLVPICQKYFRLTKFKSFLRQLQSYRFKRTTTGKFTGLCRHPLFIRGRRSLCIEIQRKSPSKKSEEASVNKETNQTDMPTMRNPVGMPVPELSKRRRSLPLPLQKIQQNKVELRKAFEEELLVINNKRRRRSLPLPTNPSKISRSEKLTPSSIALNSTLSDVREVLENELGEQKKNRRRLPLAIKRSSCSSSNASSEAKLSQSELELAYAEEIAEGRNMKQRGMEPDDECPRSVSSPSQQLVQSPSRRQRQLVPIASRIYLPEDMEPRPFLPETAEPTPILPKDIVEPSPIGNAALEEMHNVRVMEDLSDDEYEKSMSDFSDCEDDENDEREQLRSNFEEYEGEKGQLQVKLHPYNGLETFTPKFCESSPDAVRSIGTASANHSLTSTPFKNECRDEASDDIIALLRGDNFDIQNFLLTDDKECNEKRKRPTHTAKSEIKLIRTVTADVIGSCGSIVGNATKTSSQSNEKWSLYSRPVDSLRYWQS